MTALSPAAILNFMSIQDPIDISDYRPKALYEPGLCEPVSPLAKLNHRTEDFDCHNALFMAYCSHLAYHDADSCEKELAEHGLKLKDFVSHASTHFFLAADEDYAILAFRGTEKNDFQDFKTDADFRFLTVPGGQVHRGFMNSWHEIETKLRDCVEGLEQPVYACGHSLGSALACISTCYLDIEACYSFGSPKVGDADFAKLQERKTIFRVESGSDIIPTLPIKDMDYCHAGKHIFIDHNGQLHIEPEKRCVVKSKTRGELAYARKLPLFRSNMVNARTLGDHAILNYCHLLKQICENQ